MKRWSHHWALVIMVSLAGSAACKGTDAPAPQPSVPTPTITPPAGPGSAGSASAGSGSAAADPWTQQQAPTPKDPIKKPFFWSAEKDGKTTYLLGTMHMGVDAEVRLPKIVWDKLDAAPTFAMETDLSDPGLMKLMMRESGTLQEDLGPVYWKKLEDAIGPAQAKAMNGMKPMGAASLIALQNLPKTAPMDGVLLGRAMNQKKQIVFLEKAALEVAVLERHMNLKMLKMMLDTVEKSAAQTKQMLEVYLAGDADAIIATNEEQRKDALAHGFTAAEYEEQMEDILYRRNTAWIEPIEKLHAAGGGFVAVGAMHLVGKRSVNEMLEKRGFKLTRITP